MSADPTHRHDEFHRGIVPEDQLASGSPSAGDVPTWTGTGEAAYGPPGSPSEITDIPTAETDTTLRLAPDGTGGVEWATGGTGWPTAYTYDDTSNVDADPGSGNLRVDDPDFSLVTEIYFSDVASDGNDLSDWINSWAAEGGAVLGYLRIRSVEAPGAFATYHVTAITDHANYTTATVDVVANSGAFGTGPGNLAIDFWPTLP
jgi:hypothetical protein